jgi:hypothetical protein
LGLFPDGSVSGLSVSYSIFGSDRILQKLLSSREQEDLEVQFGHGGLPCLSASFDNNILESYLCVIPARVLKNVFTKYGRRLLEANVRAFLGSKNKVNKGISTTIDQAPEKFFAFNNGIAATAVSAEIVFHDNALRIKSAVGFQIVNGGQTTATIAFSANDHHLERVFVPMKLTIVPSDDGAARLVNDISRSANAQSAVKAQDFFSGNPFHRRLEAHSRLVLAPAVGGSQIETRWFYERARGQYASELERTRRLSAAEARVFQRQNPETQRVTKDLLAKSEVSWIGIPQQVSKGGEAAFKEFAKIIGEEMKRDPNQFGQQYFKDVIARIIIYRDLPKRILMPGFKSQKVAYTIAKMAFDLRAAGHLSVDFDSIWKAQSMSEALASQLLKYVDAVFTVMNVTEQGLDPGSFAKRESCWLLVQKLEVPWSNSFRSELISREEITARHKDSRIIEVVDHGIDDQTVVVSAAKSRWEGLMQWILTARAIAVSPSELSALQISAGRGPTGALVSAKQASVVLALEQRALSAGFLELVDREDIQRSIRASEGFDVGVSSRGDVEALFRRWPVVRSSGDEVTVRDWCLRASDVYGGDLVFKVFDAKHLPCEGDLTLGQVRSLYDSIEA